MGKEVLLRIDLAKVNFAYVEKTIAQYFADGRKPFTIHELAGKLSISSSSITRFCKKIGPNSFKGLMYLYGQHLNMQNTPRISNISLDLQNEYFRIFHLVDRNFDAKAMEQVCRYIYEHHIINIFAFGLSTTAAEGFRFRFSRLGKFIEVIHNKDAIKVSSRVLQKQDPVFIFTLCGNTYLGELVAELILRGILVVSILGNQNSHLRKLNNVVLYTSSLSGEESTGMISGQIPILIMIDILYYHYVRTYSDALTNWASTEEVLKDRKEQTQKSYRYTVVTASHGRALSHGEGLRCGRHFSRRNIACHVDNSRYGSIVLPHYEANEFCDIEGVCRGALQK